MTTAAAVRLLPFRDALAAGLVRPGLACAMAADAVARGGARVVVWPPTGAVVVLLPDRAAAAPPSGALDAVRTACPGAVVTTTADARALAAVIAERMARAVYSYEWINAQLDRGVRFPTRQLDDHVPKRTPRAARAHAARLVAALEAANGAPVGLLYRIAAATPGRHFKPPTPEDFGWYTALQAADYGVGWGDDHPDPGIDVPRMEFYL